ncbi:MAG: SPOR domain-containing protein [Deltaproteobacteria bacterium]
MNKNTARGLAILVAMIIIAVVLWRFLPTGPTKVKPGPATTSKPEAAPPGPKEGGQQAGAPIKEGAPSGVRALQEPGPPGPKVTVPKTPRLGKKYGILVGNYRRYPNAAKMLARLKKRGQPGFVQRDPRDPSRFQVWLGPFSSRKEARAAEKALKSILKKPRKIEEIENPVPK